MMEFTLCETLFSNSDINSIFFVPYSPYGSIGLFTIKSFTVKGRTIKKVMGGVGNF